MAIQPRLFATSGPLQGQTLTLNDGANTVGRGDNVTYVIDHRSVSRRHCEFVSKDGAVIDRDYDSTNGTMVNGVRAQERVLQHGDSVTLGNSTFIFLLEDDS